MTHNSRIIPEGFNRKTELKKNVVSSNKSLDTQSGVTLPTDPSDLNNKRILPSQINYSSNVVFPKCTCKKKCTKNRKSNCDCGKCENSNDNDSCDSCDSCDSYNSCDKKNHNEKCLSCSSNNEYTISQKDVCDHGIIITKPGTYTFCSDIVFSPCRKFTAAIIIAASNVILDLGKYSLIQGNKTINVYGIVVARDVKYVKIIGKKGIATIRNFTLAGIRVYGRTNYVEIRNLIVRQDIPQQMTNDQIPTECKNILQLSLNLGIAIGEGDTFGVHMQGTNKKNLVRNLTIDNVIADGSTIGCHMIFTFGFEILKSTFTRNTYYGLLHGTGWVVPGDGPFGLEFPVGGNGFITDCKFIENHGLNANLSNPGDQYVYDFVSGIGNYDVSNVKIDRCLIADNSNDGYIIAADHDAPRNIKWTNSVVTGTRSIFEPADGLHFSGSVAFTVGSCTGMNYPLINSFNITVDNCTVTDGISEQSRASGFVIAYVQGAHISNSNASGIIGGLSCAGFDISGGLPNGRCSNITLVNNTAERNGTAGVGRASGFSIGDVCDNIVLRNNVANGNGTGANLDYGAGFLVRSTNPDFNSFIQNIEMENCVAVGNGNNASNSGGFVLLNLTPGYIPFIDNVAIEKSFSKFNNGYGILINGSTPSDPIISGTIVGASVNETEIYQNRLGGLHVINNVYPVFASRNVAYNGNNTLNYVGIDANNIVSGIVDNLPANPGFLNTSITVS